MSDNLEGNYKKIKKLEKELEQDPNVKAFTPKGAGKSVQRLIIMNSESKKKVN